MYCFLNRVVGEWSMVVLVSVYILKMYYEHQCYDI